MRKKGMLWALILAMLLGVTAPAGGVYAAEDTEEIPETANDGNSDHDADNEKESEKETETEIPEAYYLPIESNAVKDWPAGPQVEAEAAVVMDAATGAFLYSKNMDAKEYPASITKIMTTLVAIENGDLDSKVKFSDAAINTLEADSSRLWMEVGEKITLKRALYGVMLASANDCANAVAEKVGGSMENFAQMMNDKAGELGCVNTHFVNAHGLHDENHYTCARDMAIITQAAMRNKTFTKIAKTVEYSYPKTNKTKEKRYFINHQKMLYDDDYYYEGCIGGKTGFTNDALNTLVTVAKRDGRTLICVVLRTNGSGTTFNESAMLLDYGFEHFGRETIKVSDADLTRADLLGVSYLGTVQSLEPDVLKERVVITDSNAAVSLPKEADVNQVKKTYTADGKITYEYHDWVVASIPIQLHTIEFEIPQRQIINVVEHPIAEQETETETEVGTMQKAFQSVQSVWEQLSSWVYDNDVLMALVGLILIIAMLPILIIAYIRSRKAGLIRKQRKKEKEELVHREEDIDSKSVQEIEAEIRAELEKEHLARAREAARKHEAEEAERKIKELEQVIKQEDKEEKEDLI